MWIHKNKAMVTSRLSDLDYDLPASNIALHPTAQRDASRLLVWNKGEIEHQVYSRIADYLPKNAVLVFNNTKVIAARIFFEKKTGGKIEVLLLEPANGNYASLYDKKESRWKCFVGGLKKWNRDEPITTVFLDNGVPTVLEARWLDQNEDANTILFSWNNASMTFSDIIAAAGKIPLPPYIKRQSTAADEDRYQTLYAEHLGSVAAPTAGLHFTPAIFKKLKEKHIPHAFVTLHVGAGTFKPISTERVSDHVMHEEYFEVNRETLHTLMDDDSCITAVGTTTMRTIESLYWMGVKISQTNSFSAEQITLGQWEHMELDSTQLPTRKQAMQQLLQYMERKKMDQLCGHTSICITPGYTFKMAGALVTNFHQPKSTLILLIAAIMGNDWKRTYELAVREDYRFLSYGDGCLLFIENGGR